MALVCRFCDDESDAAELVNSTFAAVIENIDEYVEQSAFFSWMCKILMSKLARMMRRKSNQMETCPGVVPDVVDEDAENWSCFLHGCENVTVRNLRICTRREPVHTHNGDGLDIDSCENVEVSGCDIDTADDGITLRALSKRLKKPRPCQNIRVSDCILSSSCNAVRVGVGDGIVRNASFSRITVRNTRTAVNFVSSWNTRSSGASFDGVSFDGMDVECMRFCRIYPFFSHSARFKGIRFANVTGTVRAPSWVTGRRDCPVGDVVFDDVRLSHGVVVHNANVSVKGGTLERIDPAEDVAVAYDAAIEKCNGFPGDMAIGGTGCRGQ